MSPTLSDLINTLAIQLTLLSAGGFTIGFCMRFTEFLPEPRLLIKGIPIPETLWLGSCITLSVAILLFQCVLCMILSAN